MRRSARVRASWLSDGRSAGAPSVSRATRAACRRFHTVTLASGSSISRATQNEVVEGWITRGVDAIAVSVENSAGISTVLRKARSRGIKVVTWDADAAPDARDYFINQATPEGIGFALVDEGARLLGGKGEFAIV